MFDPPQSFRKSNTIRLEDIPECLKPCGRTQLRKLSAPYHPDKTDDLRKHACFQYINDLKCLVEGAECTTVGDLCTRPEQAQNPEVVRMNQEVSRMKEQHAADVACAKERTDAIKRLIVENAAATTDNDAKIDMNAQEVSAKLDPDLPADLVDDSESINHMFTTDVAKLAYGDAGLDVASISNCVMPRKRPPGRPRKNHVWDGSQGCYVATQSSDDLRATNKTTTKARATAMFEDYEDFRLLLSSCQSGYKYVNKDNRDGIKNPYTVYYNGRRSHGFATPRAAALYLAKIIQS
tara:strand:+ start:221 stop:1099 length:879 start_codon:yes stop_codon:yes gene_type:complete